jgi:acyl carrier protein
VGAVFVLLLPAPTWGLTLASFQRSLSSGAVSDSIEDRIREYLVTSVGLAAALSDDDLLVEAGFVASVQLLDLVDFIEAELGVLLEPIDVMPENLTSIGAIARIVRARRAAS